MKEDRALLVHLYQVTDGSNWRNIEDWLSSKDLEYWRGVTVNEEGRVVKLDLGGNNLCGENKHCAHSKVANMSFY